MRTKIVITLGLTATIIMVAFAILAQAVMAGHEGGNEDAIEVVVGDGEGSRGGEVEIPLWFNSQSQGVTSFRFEVYFPGAHLPSVTARTDFPVGWVVSCKEFPVGMLRCTGANVGGGGLLGEYVHLNFQISDGATGSLEVRIPQETLSFFRRLTRLPAQGYGGEITIVTDPSKCFDANGRWLCG